MRFQDNQSNCGPASLSNALQALGITRTQDECARLCKTTGTDGTSAKNLLSAARAVGRDPLVLNERRADVAMLFLDNWLRMGRSAVLVVDDNSHWVAAVGLLGDRVLVADPADNELVLTYSRAKLADRWGGPRYYGVVL